MKIAAVRVIQADIPVVRPHKMSFTTLEAVHFVFVRMETVDGLVGWGEAACLGGAPWGGEASGTRSGPIEHHPAPLIVGRDAGGVELPAPRTAPPPSRHPLP